MDQPSGKGVGNLQRILVTAGSKRATLRKLGKPLAAMVFGSLLSISQAAHAQNKYDFITIDVTGEEVTRTAANGTSTHEIVGEFDDKDGTHGFVLNKGVFTTIDFPNASVTLLNGINASGQLMGTYVDSTGKLFAFVGNKGDFTKLDPFGLEIRSQGGFINAQGQAVGAYRDASQKRHGFIWRKGKFAPPVNVPGDDELLGTVALGINDIGDVVGNYVDDKTENRHGFLLSSKGVFTNPIDVPGAVVTVAQGINNAGTIVGVYIDAQGNSHGFVLSKGVFTNPIDVPGASGTQINSINAKGEIVGSYDDSAGQHGFLGTPTR